MRYFLLTALIFLAKYALCQHLESCGFTRIHQDRLMQDKQYASDVFNAEIRLADYLKAKHQNLIAARTEAIVYKIPVVFHVIHTGGIIGTADNPTDANIIATLQLLNNAWRKNGASFGGADMEIQFELAKRSPGCGSTSGINRVNGSAVSDYAANGITTSGSNNEVAVKGLSHWSTADYLNIWIVTKIDGSNTFPGGYAYFPEHADSRIDGITILANTVDGNNKTIVHEMGHVFGLYHTFEVANPEVNNCAPTTDCATTGDHVCDTEPVQNVSCGNIDNACTGTAFAVADVAHNFTVVNNFMGYATCQWMFTEGQKDRARGFLELFRPGLLRSQALSLATATPASIPALTANQGLSQSYGIERVQFNTINIYSGTSFQDNGNYINRTCNQRTSVGLNSSYTFTVAGTYGNPQYLKAYIDYNNDGDFMDSGEEVISGDWVGSVSGNIIIPANAVTNTPLLMRVVADDKYLSPPTSLLLNGQGQVEDYTIQVNAALPVTLIYFKGKLIDRNQVDLIWATSSEDNSQSFDLERGNSLKTMEKIGSIDAAGNSVSNINYQFTDRHPLQGINYYKLTGMDWDGSRHTYKTIAIETKNEEILYPNPSANNIFYLKTSANTQIRIHTILGQEVQCEYVTEAEGLTRVITSQKLVSGIYLVSLTNGDSSRSLRFIVP